MSSSSPSPRRRARESGPVLLPGATRSTPRSSGRLPEVLADLGATGDEGDVTRFPAPPGLGAKLVLAVGVGSSDAGRRGAAARARRSAVRAQRRPGLPARSRSTRPAGPLAEGALLGAYAFEGYREKDPKRAPVENVVLLGIERTATMRAATTAPPPPCARRGPRPVRRARPRPRSTCRPATCSPADLPTAPSPRRPGRRRAPRSGTRTRWPTQGFGGILGVGKGSVEPAAAGPARLAPAERDAARSRWSARASRSTRAACRSSRPRGMEYMKIDMAGAAAVLATVLAAARLELPISGHRLAAARREHAVGSAPAPRPTC